LRAAHISWIREKAHFSNLRKKKDKKLASDDAPKEGLYRTTLTSEELPSPLIISSGKIGSKTSGGQVPGRLLIVLIVDISDASDLLGVDELFQTTESTN